MGSYLSPPVYTTTPPFFFLRIRGDDKGTAGTTLEVSCFVWKGSGDPGGTPSFLGPRRVKSFFSVESTPDNPCLSTWCVQGDPLEVSYGYIVRVLSQDTFKVQF